jgi:hypothetical protein
MPGAYSATLVRSVNVTTLCGQRRILKWRRSKLERIELGVKSGSYRTRAEVAQIMRDVRDANQDDLTQVLRRIRQDGYRGSNVHDYPVDYMIMQQHPPIPDPPRLTARERRALKIKTHEPMNKLSKKYVEKLQGERAPMTTEDYYRRLLGVPQPPAFSTLGQKPAVVQKAYALAVRNYELQRTHGLSERDAMDQVEELLKEERIKEQTYSRAITESAQQLRKQDRNWRVKTLFEAEEAEGWDEDKLALMNEIEAKWEIYGEEGGYDRDQFYEKLVEETPEDDVWSSDEVQAELRGLELDDYEKRKRDNISLEDIQSLFGDDYIKLEGMMRWSERLQAVPYKEWTVGASTALDHWIARRLLNHSEQTWQDLLEGVDPRLISQGRDIVALREALFPETRLDDSWEEDMQAQQEEEEELDDQGTVEEEIELEPLSVFGSSRDRGDEKSIEELLSSLSGISPPARPGMDDSKPDPEPEIASSAIKLNDTSSISWLDDANASEFDIKIGRLVMELQDWRHKNVQTPFDEWSKAEQIRMNEWVKHYIVTLEADSPSKGPIDVEGTRMALLASKPVTPGESEEFWDQLADETRARDLLDKMLQDGPPPGASLLHSAFWDLEYEEQLERLLNMGALRPLLDEYTKESDRSLFLQRHADTLLLGVEMPHLVVDPDGPISYDDIGRKAAEMGFNRSQRFRIEMVQYKGSIHNAEPNSPEISALDKSRLLYKAWNLHKAGRARYEEKMFQLGRLGLKYSDIPKQADEETEEDINPDWYRR